MKGFWDKLEKFFLFLFLLLIPTQLGRHWWPEWSLVNGIRVDYLSPTLYLIDVVWIFWLAIKFSIFNFQFSINKDKIFNFHNLIVLLFVGVNIVLAGNRWEAGYKWVRIGQWAITYKIFNFQFSIFKTKEYLKWIIPCWVIVEVFLAVGQVVMGHNVGGIFYWLGERRFNFNTVGIAQMSWWGNGVLRAYGTFSHPNSLAGFMLVCWIVWGQNPSVRLGRTSPLEKGRQNRTVFWWMINWLMVLIMVVAGSRIVWLVATLKLLITNYELRIKKSKKKTGWIVFGVGVVLILLGYWGNRGNQGILGGWDSDSLTKRLELNVAAIGMIRENPLFGVGAGNFLNKLPEYQQMYKFYWLQPVHNIFLLVWSEVGSLGIILGIWLIAEQIHPARQSRRDPPLTRRVRQQVRWWIIFSVLMTGMVDHYWLTLPQNSWLLAVILAIEMGRHAGLPLHKKTG